MGKSGQFSNIKGATMMAGAAGLALASTPIPFVAAATPLLLAAAPAIASSPPRPDDLCNLAATSAIEKGTGAHVLLIKHFAKGDRLRLGHETDRTGKPDTSPVPLSADDVCVIKLVTGPSVSGPADAPSTTKGVGIEVWLPASSNWNSRFLSIVPGGWAGERAVKAVDALSSGRDMGFALEHGYITSKTDLGVEGGRGSEMILPDGSINRVGWENLVSRSGHIVATTVKALATLYYNKAPSYSYVTGCSSGGRASYASAQQFPNDYDGVLAGAPSINQTSFPIGLVYPQLVMIRDLGGVLPMPKLDFVSRAAIRACDTTVTGQHDGYLSDPETCHYNPVQDQVVLCLADGGTGPDALCVTKREAQAINKMWFGGTRDGSVPDPKADNGASPFRSSDHYWWGPYRGTTMATVANSRNGQPAPFDLAVDQIAVNMENPSLGTPTFRNGSGNGADGWKQLDYAGLAEAADRGMLLNTAFAGLNSNNPDLRPFAAAGKKMITYHGLADQNMPPQNSLNYYAHVAAVVGGVRAEQAFHRLFLVPGMGHCVGFGTVGATAAPQPSLAAFLDLLVAWVEKNRAPQEIVAETIDNKMSRPVCTYPQKAIYRSGPVASAVSYFCGVRLTGAEQ
ncbi:MAG: tannase/feruloyl esterase family alpha/beta hydrolase [Sphingomonadales bacterium]|nr:tannase/feruloyl esterase family alpha/beta hydrolase [Sphingomonadales bacterium]